MKTQNRLRISALHFLYINDYYFSVKVLSAGITLVI